jgi:hypothetical protein
LDAQRPDIRQPQRLDLASTEEKKVTYGIRFVADQALAFVDKFLALKTTLFGVSEFYLRIIPDKIEIFW